MSLVQKRDRNETSPQIIMQDMINQGMTPQHIKEAFGYPTMLVTYQKMTEYGVKFAGIYNTREVIHLRPKGSTTDRFVGSRFTADGDIRRSLPIPVGFARQFIPNFNLIIVGTVTTAYIRIEIEFSEDETNWYRYEVGAYAYMVESGNSITSSGKLFQPQNVVIGGKFVRISLTCTDSAGQLSVSNYLRLVACSLVLF